MPKYFSVLLIFLLAGCSTFGWGRATPVPITEDIALERFLTQAPASLRTIATPIPVSTVVYVAPSGLPLPLVDPLEVVGNLTTSGSRSLVPLTRLLYDRFVIAGYRDTMRIEEVNERDIFDRYCTSIPIEQSAIDIALADRPVRQSELERCLQQNKKLVALRVAYDAVVIVVNSEATFISNVSKADLMAVLTARRWSDVRRSWPDAEIVRVVPASDSTIATLVTDKVLQHNALLLQNASETTFLEDGKEIATTIADTPFSVGFLTYGDYQEYSNGLRLLTVDGIQPNHQTVSRGRYALTYPLLLYTDLATLEAKPQVSAFLLYYLATVNEVIDEAGNFSLDEAFYERTKVVLLNALGQSAYLEQFAPTSTPAPPATMTPILTMTPMLTSTTDLTATMTVTR